MACIEWSKPFAYLFWVNYHLSKAFFQKKARQESRNRPFFSLPPNHTLWIPWPKAHFPCISWVQVGGASTLIFTFHYPLCLSSFAPLPFLPFLPCLLLLHVLCSCLSSTIWKAWALGLASFPLISLWAWMVCWQKSLLTQPTGVLLLLFSFPALFVAC